MSRGLSACMTTWPAMKNMMVPTSWSSRYSGSWISSFPAAKNRDLRPAGLGHGVQVRRVGSRNKRAGSSLPELGENRCHPGGGDPSAGADLPGTEQKPCRIEARRWHRWSSESELRGADSWATPPFALGVRSFAPPRRTCEDPQWGRRRSADSKLGVPRASRRWARDLGKRLPPTQQEGRWHRLRALSSDLRAWIPPKHLSGCRAGGRPRVRAQLGRPRIVPGDAGALCRLSCSGPVAPPPLQAAAARC